MDLTFSHIVFQLLVFLTLLAVLNIFIFQPLLRLEAQREKETSKREHEAADIMERSQVMIERYNQALSEAKAEADRKYQLATQAAQKQSKEIIQAARSEGQEFFNREKQTVFKEQAQLKREVEQATEKLADELMAQII